MRRVVLGFVVLGPLALAQGGDIPVHAQDLLPDAPFGFLLQAERRDGEVVATVVRWPKPAPL